MKEGWTYKKLGEIALDMYRGSGIKRDQVTKEGVPCVRYGEIYTTYNYAFDECVSHTNEECITSPKYFSHGDLLFAITGESVEDIGKTIAYLGNDKCLLGGDIVCMKHEQNPKYLAYALSSRDAIRQKGYGKTKLKVVHTSIPALSEIKIPIAPLDEQQRIVERLDSAFENIDELKANAEKQLAEARTLFQKSLAKAMEPKEGWEVKALKELGMTQTGTTPSKNDKENYGDFIPFIRPSEIDYDDCGNIDYNSEIKLSEKGLSAGRLFKKGSILMVCIGATISKVGFVTQDVSCNQQINVLTPKKEYYYKFIYYAMRNKEFKDKVIKEGTSSQATLPIINKGKWERLTISLPPLAEQQRIVERLDALSENIRKYEEIQRQIISECDALKQTLLRKVFE